ncbi:MAG: amidohydrolase family protein [Candidatus Hydrogenedentota bacterium]
MKLDAHQHFWKYSADEYDWMNDEMQVLRRDHLPDELNILQQSLDFDGSIAVQARQTLEETRWLLDLADAELRIKGVVGWLDLCSDQIESQLEEFSPMPKLVGLRHVVHDEPDDEFMLGPDFLRGLALLNNYDLVYDILIFEKHLPVTLKVVEQFPDHTFVLNHIAKPLIKDGILSPWDEHIRSLAQFPNVACKLSGMVTEADWADWTNADILPYIDICLEAFGPDRLMIGSDWPVCTLASDYAGVMNLIIDYIDTLTPSEQEAILGGTCARVYRISA